jgi:hypothetical protein
MVGCSPSLSLSLPAARRRRRHSPRSARARSPPRRRRRSEPTNRKKRTHRHAQVDNALVKKERGEVRRRGPPPIVARAARVHGHGGAARERRGREDDARARGRARAAAQRLALHRRRRVRRRHRGGAAARAPRAPRCVREGGGRERDGPQVSACCCCPVCLARARAAGREGGLCFRAIALAAAGGDRRS